MLGEHHRCPHCHAIAGVEPSPEARFLCAVCGGVRIPIEDPKVTHSPEQIEHLKRATNARSAGAVWQMVAAIVGAFGIFSVLVLWLAITVAHPPLVASVVAALAVMVPFAFAVLAWRRSRACLADFAPAFDKAWIAAAADVARSRGGTLDRAELAKVTRITEQEADKVLARMSAESLATSSVTAEGVLTYTLVEAGASDTAKSSPSSG